MSILFGILAVIVWLIGQYIHEKACRDAGVPLLTSRQYRYMRRKARRTGTTLDTVDYGPRTRQSPLFFKDWLGPNPLSPNTTVPPARPQKKGGRVLLGLVGFAGIMLSTYLAARHLTSRSQVPPPPPTLEASVTTLPAPLPPAASPVSQAHVGRMKQTANVRVGPSNAAAVLRTIPANTAVRIIDTNATWAKVALDDAVAIGWVYRPLIE